jgi:xanthine/uracil permease
MDIAEKIIVALVVIVIGLALVPTILNSTATAVNSTTNTTYQSLLNIVPLVFIAGILLVSVALFMTHKEY